MADLVREFPSGATRSSSENKPDYEGFLHPEVLRMFADYMHKHRFLPNGTVRESDNWQKGIPTEELMKSLLRHVIDLWRMHRKGVHVIRDEEETKRYPEQLASILFNTQALMLNYIREES